LPEEIFKADHRYRKHLFISYGVGILVLTLLCLFGLPLVLRYLRSCEIPEFLLITECFAIAFLFCFIGPALFLINTGRKILFYKQAPYPGQKVIRDTKTVFGKKAMFRGRLLIILGIASIIIAIAGSIITHYKFEKFRHFNPFQSVTRVALM
jgi:hypothetical protein